MKLFNKLLIANRGEIAARIHRSAQKLGIRTVAIYSLPDENALHVRLADEAYSLGEGDLAATYLNTDKILDIARHSGCEAIHPGYGFLSENPDFCRAVEAAGLVFIGPSAKAIHLMGNKIEARAFALDAGVPVTPGATGNAAALLEASRSMKFPLLVKAAAGGGGKGMRIVHSGEELESALETTEREAKNYFGDGTIYLEKFIENPRHIEVQLLGDKHGNVIHFFERECSIQRRYQKIIEESPSPTLTPDVRAGICDAALRLGKAIAYDNAGTIEFLVDENLEYYFLEMNTRIQVEHPVTEMVTNYDLVEEQILIAAGNPCRVKQEEIHQNGHAIECRIYAEDPSNNFMPSPGEIILYHEPEGAGIRIDSAIDGPGVIRSFFDPMISKIIAWGQDREIARHRMTQALKDYVLHGIKSNIPYLLGILDNEAYRENLISTRFCDEQTSVILEALSHSKEQIPGHIPLTAYLLHSLGHALCDDCADVWRRIGYWRLGKGLTARVDGKEHQVIILRRYGKHIHFLIDGVEYETTLLKMSGGRIDATINGSHHTAYASTGRSGHTWLTYAGYTFDCERNDFLIRQDVFSAAELGADSDRICSPMPGKVIKVNVKDGDEVKKGQVLLIVEAMKMENNVLATKDGTIETVNTRTGEMVDPAMELINMRK